MKTHKNSMALKNACVQIWRKARWGWLMPRVTIMRPNWLEVENATIFLNVVLGKCAEKVN